MNGQVLKEASPAAPNGQRLVGHSPVFHQHRLTRWRGRRRALTGEACESCQLAPLVLVCPPIVKLNRQHRNLHNTVPFIAG